MCRFSLSCGCTQLETFHHGGSQSFTPSPPGSQRPLLRETWDAVLEHGGLGAQGMLWDRGAGGKDRREEPVAVPSSRSSGFLCLPVTFGRVFASGTASLQSLTSTCHGASVLQKLGGSQAWAGGGQNSCPRSPPEQDPGKPLPSLTHSLPQCPGVVVSPSHLFMNQVHDWLFGGSFFNE